MAYAKYLSPELHVKCNTVFRAHVEGRNLAVAETPSELMEIIRRTDGICRMLAAKVTRIEKAVANGNGAPASFTITINPTTGDAA